MKYFYDTEFLEDGELIELISIGIVAEDGREYYAVSHEVTRPRLARRIRRHDFLMQCVVPHLPQAHGDRRNTVPERWLFDYASPLVKRRATIADEVHRFLLPEGVPTEPELWAWYAAYDHVALCQLWGRMIDLPDGVPMWTNDLKQEVQRLGNPTMPKQDIGEHNALADARHVRHMYNVLFGSLEVEVHLPGMATVTDEQPSDTVGQCYRCDRPRKIRESGRIWIDGDNYPSCQFEFSNPCSGGEPWHIWARNNPDYRKERRS